MKFLQSPGKYIFYPAFLRSPKAKISSEPNTASSATLRAVSQLPNVFSPMTRAFSQTMRAFSQSNNAFSQVVRAFSRTITVHVN